MLAKSHKMYNGPHQMPLVIDIGNTNVAFALYKGRRLVKSWQIPTTKCAKTYFLQKALHDMAPDGIVIASVVPGLNRAFTRICKKLFGLRPVFATPKNIPIKIRGYNKKQIGVDRLLAASAAYKRFKKAVVIVDVGSAITIDAVNSKGEFLGGAIAPGPSLAIKALHDFTAKLPLIKGKRTKQAIAKNTRDAILSGAYLGLAGLIDRIVMEITKETRTHPTVVITGGMARRFKKTCRTIDHVHPNLVLEGLRQLGE